MGDIRKLRTTWSVGGCSGAGLLEVAAGGGGGDGGGGGVTAHCYHCCTT